VRGLEAAPDTLLDARGSTGFPEFSEDGAELAGRARDSFRAGGPALGAFAGDAPVSAMAFGARAGGGSLGGPGARTTSGGEPVETTAVGVASRRTAGNAACADSSVAAGVPDEPILTNK
jgi:hypothetical protein